MNEIRVDTSKLEATLEEFAKLSRKDLGEVTKQQAGILVGHVIAITPPGHKEAFSNSGGISISAKKAGEVSIESDIRKLFPTSKLKHDELLGMVHSEYQFKTGKRTKNAVREVAETEQDLARIHQNARNPRTGRTLKLGGINMAVTRITVLKAYIRKEKLKVGKLNAGWINAARELKTASRNLPAWITRHGAKPGGADISDRGSRIRIRIYNSQPWFPQAMEGRVHRAVQRREAGLVKAMEAMLERRAKAAERRMGN